MERPKLTDSKEFALVRSMYFEKDFHKDERLDPIERLERQNSKNKNLINQSR